MRYLKGKISELEGRLFLIQWVYSLKSETLLPGTIFQTAMLHNQWNEQHFRRQKYFRKGFQNLARKSNIHKDIAIRNIEKTYH